MINTPYHQWSHPEENDDPYYDIIADFFIEQDDTTFGLMNTASNIIIPPDIVSWNPIAHMLTWNNDFVIPLMSVGFNLNIQFGPDGLTRAATFAEGDRMIVVVPRTSTGTITANFSLVNGAVNIQNGLFTVGFCRGYKFYANFPQVFT